MKKKKDGLYKMCSFFLKKKKKKKKKKTINEDQIVFMKWELFFFLFYKTAVGPFLKAKNHGVLLYHIIVNACLAPFRPSV